MTPKIYIGIVTHEAKRYCLDAFFSSLKAISYPNKIISIADNSEDADGYSKEFSDIYEYHRMPLLEVADEQLSRKRNATHMKAINYLFDDFLKSDCEQAQKRGVPFGAAFWHALDIQFPKKDNHFVKKR